MCVDVFSLCAFLCRRRVDGVNITAAMCLFPRVLVCDVSVISTGLNHHLPSIYGLCVYMHIRYDCVCVCVLVSVFVCPGQAY